MLLLLDVSCVSRRQTGSSASVSSQTDTVQFLIFLKHLWRHFSLFALSTFPLLLLIDPLKRYLTSLWVEEPCVCVSVCVIVTLVKSCRNLLLSHRHRSGSAPVSETNHWAGFRPALLPRDSSHSGNKLAWLLSRLLLKWLSVMLHLRRLSERCNNTRHPSSSLCTQAFISMYHIYIIIIYIYIYICQCMSESSLKHFGELKDFNVATLDFHIHQEFIMWFISFFCIKTYHDCTFWILFTNTFTFNFTFNCYLFISVLLIEYLVFFMIFILSMNANIPWLIVWLRNSSWVKCYSWFYFGRLSVPDDILHPDEGVRGRWFSAHVSLSLEGPPVPRPSWTLCGIVLRDAAK